MKLAWETLLSLWSDGPPNSEATGVRAKECHAAFVDKVLSLIPGELKGTDGESAVVLYNAAIDIMELEDTITEFATLCFRGQDMLPSGEEQAQAYTCSSKKLFAFLNLTLVQHLLRDATLGAPSVCCSAGGATSSQQVLIWLSGVCELLVAFQGDCEQTKRCKKHCFLMVDIAVLQEEPLTNVVAKLRKWSELYARKVELQKSGEAVPFDDESLLSKDVQKGIMAFNVRAALSGPNNLIEDFIKSMMKDCETNDDKFMLTGQELIGKLPSICGALLDDAFSHRELRRLHLRSLDGLSTGLGELTRILVACSLVGTFFKQDEKFSSMQTHLQKDWSTVAIELVKQCDIDHASKFVDKYKDLDNAIEAWRFDGKLSFLMEKEDPDADRVAEMKAMDMLCGRLPTSLRVLDALAPHKSDMTWGDVSIVSSLQKLMSTRDTIGTTAKLTASTLASLMLTNAKLTSDSGSSKQVDHVKAFCSKRLGVVVTSLSAALQRQLSDKTMDENLGKGKTTDTPTKPSTGSAQPATSKHRRLEKLG